jgi:hypothetical protein
VETSVQRENVNYFGRYIEQCVRAIPVEEIQSPGLHPVRLTAS